MRAVRTANRMTWEWVEKNHPGKERSMILSTYFGCETPKLGFGFMRLPRTADGKHDIEQIKQMVDVFMEAGLTYFDTAFVYDGGDSERAMKAALIDRYPRDKFTVATKINVHANGHCGSEEAVKEQLAISLERTGAGYFDYYLLHAMGRGNYQLFDEYHIWDFVKQKKEEGLIRHYGFSFHGDPELLDELLTKHPDVDFIQLQINYIDWESENVASRKCYEVARKHGKSITVMEPVKGGTLATLPEDCMNIFHEADPKASAASWAIRYVATLDGIITVLSGMSNLEQVQDNVSYMKDFKPLTDADQDVINKVIDVLHSRETIACTACHYCTEGCPMQIHIPDIFSARNVMHIYNNLAKAKGDYSWNTRESGKASDCIACGQCESQCPQHLPIIELLKECATTLE